MFQIDELTTGNLIDHLVSGRCSDCDTISNGLPISNTQCVSQVVA